MPHAMWPWERGRRRPPTGSTDRGSGSVLALALVATVVVVALAALSLGAGLVTRQRVVGAADAAALVAADALRGLIPGVPCELADRVVRSNGAALEECSGDGYVATVAVSGSWLGLPLRAAASAGPPPRARRPQRRNGARRRRAGALQSGGASSASANSPARSTPRTCVGCASER